jgi:hypothetical protein
MYKNSNPNSLNESSTDSSTSQSNNQLSDNNLEPNYNTIQGLRRSLRTHKPLNKLNVNLATILCLTFFCNASSLAIVNL